VDLPVTPVSSPVKYVWGQRDVVLPQNALTDAAGCIARPELGDLAFINS